MLLILMMLLSMSDLASPYLTLCGSHLGLLVTSMVSLLGSLGLIGV